MKVILFPKFKSSNSKLAQSINLTLKKKNIKNLIQLVPTYLTFIIFYKNLLCDWKTTRDLQNTKQTDCNKKISQSSEPYLTKKAHKNRLEIIIKISLLALQRSQRLVLTAIVNWAPSRQHSHRALLSTLVFQTARRLIHCLAACALRDLRL